MRDHKLVFNKPAGDGSGYANIQPCSGEVVYGVLYKITPEELAKLDIYEGVHCGHYYRESLEVTTISGEIVIAECYLAKKICNGLRPRFDYLSHLIRGAEEHGLPKDYIEKLKSWRWDN